MLTVDDVMDRLDDAGINVTPSKLNYVLTRDGIEPSDRGGRGRGGARLFAASQMPSIKAAFKRTRAYRHESW